MSLKFLPSAMRRPALAFVLLAVTLPARADIIGPIDAVTDGDTLALQGVLIRLHGVDAPERSQTCGVPQRRWRCGDAARAELERLVARQQVTCRPRDRDRYGRTIATCWVSGKDIAAALVRAGLALAFRRYSLDYVGVEAEAQKARRGMWAGPFVAPWDWRRGIRG